MSEEGKVVWIGVKCKGCGEDTLAFFDLDAADKGELPTAKQPAFFASYEDAGHALGILANITAAIHGRSSSLGPDVDASPLLQPCLGCRRQYMYRDTDFFITAEDLPPSTIKLVQDASQDTPPQEGDQEL